MRTGAHIPTSSEVEHPLTATDRHGQAQLAPAQKSGPQLVHRAHLGLAGHARRSSATRAAPAWSSHTIPPADQFRTSSFSAPLRARRSRPTVRRVIRDVADLREHGQVWRRVDELDDSYCREAVSRTGCNSLQLVITRVRYTSATVGPGVMWRSWMISCRG